MAKSKFEVGGWVDYRLSITRVGKEGVTVAFPDGTKKTIKADDDDILEVHPMPKEKSGRIGTSKLAKAFGDEE
ncbi:MAG TPA: hypothetical protein VMF90_21835 [Rhizobiaceae bacterium]|nr:hypothetical protein [Rhizobiaceae bacterium]